MNVVDSQVIDIGFANVVGADRIADGEGVYDGQFTPLIDRGDSYGPFDYISYVPFEQLLPVGRRPREPARRPRSPRSSSTSRSSALLLLAGPPTARRRRGPRARDRARLRLARLPLHALCARRQRRQRRARRGAARRRPDRVRLAAQARARDRARGGDEVRPAGAGAAVRRRVGGAAHPLDADLRGRLRRRLGRRAAAAASRRRLPRVLRPHVRLPGVARLAVQRLGPRAVARRRSRTSPVPSRSCSASLLFFLPRRRTALQVAALGAAAADRDPGRLDPLVLLLHPLVDALRPDQRLRDAGADLGSRPGAGCRYRASPVRRYLERRHEGCRRDGRGGQDEVHAHDHR